MWSKYLRVRSIDSIITFKKLLIDRRRWMRAADRHFVEVLYGSQRIETSSIPSYDEYFDSVEVSGECKVNRFSSRSCELGTKGCIEKHS